MGRHVPCCQGLVQRDRHKPEDSVLYRVVQGHLAEFLRRAREFDGVGMPYFVEQAFQAFLTCGLMEFGFARVVCACGHEEAVAFSCKKRGVCPLCMGRMMADRSAHLVDNVLPTAPIRQWVVGFPFAVQRALAFRPKALADAERMIQRHLLAFMAQRAGGKSGGLFVRHRMGSSLNVAPHGHILLLDGAYQGEDAPVFKAAPPLRQEELDALCLKMAASLRRVLKKHKLHDDATAAQPDALAAATAAGMERGAREKSGPALSLVDEDEVENPRARLVANAGGLNVYASPIVGGKDREGLERLVSYLLRPPFATSRFFLRDDGLVGYRMKKADRKGNTVLVMDPVQLLGRLAALIPAPRRQTHRLFGVLGAASKIRSQIVPKATHRKPAKASVNDDDPPAYKQVIDWAELLQRTFLIDPLCCPRCSGRMRVVAVIRDTFQARRFAAHVGTARDTRVTGPPELAA